MVREKHCHVPVITLASLAAPLVSGLGFFFSLFTRITTIGTELGAGRSRDRTKSLSVGNPLPYPSLVPGLWAGGEKAFSSATVTGPEWGSEGMARARRGGGKGQVAACGDQTVP